MDEIEVLQASLEKVRNLRSPSPPPSWMLIGLAANWKDYYWEPYMEGCIEQASRRAGEYTDPFRRRHSKCCRSTRLHLFSHALGRYIESMNDLTEEEAIRILRWLEGHHPDHVRYSYEIQVEEMEERKFQTYLWLEFNRGLWHDV